MRNLFRRLGGYQGSESRCFRFRPEDKPPVRDPFRYYKGGVENAGSFSSDLLTRLNIPEIARTVDRHSARFGIESRLPFLDEDLVDFCLLLPSEHLVKDGKTKLLLREAMRGTVPEVVRMRSDKMDMELPEELWFYGSESFRFKEIFREATKACLEAKGEKIMSMVGNEKVKNPKLPWRILIYGRWLRSLSR